MPLHCRVRCHALHKGGAANIGHLGHRFARRQPMGYFHDRTFSIAVQQNIALRVHQNTAPHFVLPIIIMRNAAQATLYAAQNNRRVRIRLAAALRIHQRRTVGAQAADIIRAIGIVTANFSVRCVAVNHAVHIARRHAVKQHGFA